MNGPGHGKTVELTAAHKELMWQGPPANRFMPFDHDSYGPSELVKVMRPKIHVYKYIDCFGNDNMEETYLYTHDGECCDDVWKDPDEVWREEIRARRDTGLPGRSMFRQDKGEIF